MLGALTESDKRDVRSLPGGHGPDVLDFDLPRNHLVTESDHDWGNDRKAILALVGDQDTQMIGLAVAHGYATSVGLYLGTCPKSTALISISAEHRGFRCPLRVRGHARPRSPAGASAGRPVCPRGTQVRNRRHGADRGASRRYLD